MLFDKNETPLCLFVDLAKTFDTINHDQLLDSLEYEGLSKLNV